MVSSCSCSYCGVALCLARFLSSYTISSTLPALGAEHQPLLQLLAGLHLPMVPFQEVNNHEQDGCITACSATSLHSEHGPSAPRRTHACSRQSHAGAMHEDKAEQLLQAGSSFPGEERAAAATQARVTYSQIQT